MVKLEVEKVVDETQVNDGVPKNEAEIQKAQNELFEPDRLDFIKAELNAAFAELNALQRKGIDKAIYLGGLLLEVKLAVGHGHWKEWVRSNVQGSSYSTCKRWMKIAKHKDKVNETLRDWPGVMWTCGKITDYLNDNFFPAVDDEFETEELGNVLDDDPVLDEGESDDEEDEGEFLSGEVLPLTFGSNDEGKAKNNGNGKSGGKTKPGDKTKPGGKDKGKTDGRGLGTVKGDSPALHLLPGAQGVATRSFEIVLIQVFNVTVPITDSVEVVKRAIETGKVSLEARSDNLEWTFSNGGLFPSICNPVVE